MHELSITRNVVAIVAEHAAGRQVKRVRLQIGQLSAVMPGAIRFCFELCAAGSVLAGAALEIDETPGRGRCPRCAMEVALTELAGRCPDCAGMALEIVAGQEMLIKEFECHGDLSLPHPLQKETEPCA